MRKLIAALLLFVALPLSAATFTVSSSVYQPGTRDVGIPVGVLDTDTSVNGGPNQQLCGFAAEGGDVFDRHGNLYTESYVECSLPPGTARTVTVVLTNTVQLRTAMTVTTSP